MQVHILKVLLFILQPFEGFPTAIMMENTADTMVVLENLIPDTRYDISVSLSRLF